MSDLISRSEALESLKKEYNRRHTGDGLKLAWIEKAINDVPSAEVEDEDDGK